MVHRKYINCFEERCPVFTDSSLKIKFIYLTFQKKSNKNALIDTVFGQVMAERNHSKWVALDSKETAVCDMNITLGSIATLVYVNLKVEDCS